MGGPDIFTRCIRLFSLGGCGYLSYYILHTIYYETKVKKLEQRRRNVEQRGETYEETNQDQMIYNYMDNHYGNRLLQQIQVRENITEQVQDQITKKNEIRQRLLQDNKEEDVEQIEKEIEQLNHLFTSVRPRSQKYFLKQD